MELKTVLIITITIISFGLAAWMFPGKMAKDVFKKLRLFPRWFKILGVIIIIISAIMPFEYEFLLFEGKNYIGVHYSLLGLFLISFSRDKIEDEMTSMIRLKSLYRSTIMTFAITMMFYAINSIWVTEGELITGIDIMMYILMIYLMNFYITKFRIKREQ